MQNTYELLRNKLQEALEEIRISTSQDELEKAFLQLERLAEVLSPVRLGDITLNRGSMNRNKREYTSGKISYEEYFRTRTRISAGLLDELQELSQHPIFHPSKGSNTYRQLMVEKDLSLEGVGAMKRMMLAMDVASGLGTVISQEGELGYGFLVDDHYFLTRADAIDLSEPHQKYGVWFLGMERREMLNQDHFQLDLSDYHLSEPLGLVKIKVLARNPSQDFPKKSILDSDFQILPGEKLNVFQKAGDASGAIILQEVEVLSIEGREISVKMRASDHSLCLPIFNKDWAVIAMFQNSGGESRGSKGPAGDHGFTIEKAVLASALLSTIQDSAQGGSHLPAAQVAPGKSKPHIFVMYDQKEKEFAEDFIIHLKLIEGVDIFDMHQDVGFGDRAKTIMGFLQKADLVACLVSPRLFMSYNDLLTEARKMKGKVVVPILLKSVDWENTVLGGLNCLPIDKQFVAQMADPDVAFSNMARRIKTFLSSISSA